MPKLPTTGIYLPPLIASQVGSTVHKLATPFNQDYGDEQLLVTQSGVIGIMRLDRVVDEVDVEVFDADKSHGVQPRLRKAWWPEAKRLGTVSIQSYEPLAEPVEVAVNGHRYGDAIHVQQLEAVVLSPRALPILRKAQSLACEWHRAIVPFAKDMAGKLGPQTRAFFLMLPSVCSALDAELESFRLRATRKAAPRDPWEVTEELHPVLVKLAGLLPQDAGSLRASVLEAADAAARVLDHAQVLKRNLPGLKVPDPIYLLDRLEEQEEAGILSAQPRRERAGKEQVLLNEMQQKEGTPDEYARPYAWALVRHGLPKKVKLEEVPSEALDPFTRAEFKERQEEELWFLPLELVKRYDPPLELRRPIRGRRYASDVDLDRDVLKKAEEELPDPISLSGMTVQEVRRVALALSDLYEEHFADNDKITSDGFNREDLVNAYVFVLEEFSRRGVEGPGVHRGLVEEADRLSKRLPDGTGQTAPIYPGSKGTLEAVRLEEFTQHLGKPIVLRSGAVHLVGSICNFGETKNDIDVLLLGPMDDGLRKVIEFRVGRMFPGGISQRINFIHDPEMGGPFTNHIPMYDLVLLPHSEAPALVEMSTSVKADDPLMDLPASGGPRRGVLQYHFRGRTLHGDLRFKAGDFLVGWTLLLQKPGISPPETIAQARDIAKDFNPDGGRYNKDMLAPEGIQATPKKRQPVSWLHLEGDFIEPGEVGATRNLPGVIVAVPSSFSFVEWGVQEPWFHEYFLTGGSQDKLTGRLMFRQLTGSRQSETDLPFWRAFLSKDYLPSILNRRSVNQKRMPPDGYSWIPKTLERVTPREFQYWRLRGAKAREARDALVDERFFTSDNIKLVNGKFVRVEEKRKVFLYLPDGLSQAELLKAPENVDYVLSYQAWKGQQVVRAGPSREVWHLAFKLPGGKVDFQLQADPTNGGRISAIRKPLRSDELWSLSGDVSPGKSYGGDVFNDTKATDSTIRILGKGKAMLLEQGSGVLRFQIRSGPMRGVHVLAAEEAGSNIWLYEQSEGPGKMAKASPPMRGEVQVWDPDKIPDGADRSNDRLTLRPPALIKPQKVAPRRSNQFNSWQEAKETFATQANLRQGIVVEPKLNGFRLEAQGWQDKTLIYTEDEWRDISDTLPGFAKDLRALRAPFALDGEGMAVDDDGNYIPRRDLAKYHGRNAVDDANFRFHVFNALYLPGGGNLLADGYLEQKKKLARFMRAVRSKRFVLVQHKVAHTEAELKAAIEWASKEPGSEGAMLKLADSTYSLGGENDGWAKLKVQRLIQAIVYGRDPVEGSPGVWNYSMAVGPVRDPDKWKETVEIKDKVYTVIGNTSNSKVKAEVGDVLAVNVLELLYEQDAQGRKRLHWFGPPAVEGDAPLNSPPFGIQRVIGMLEREEFKKHLEDIIVDLGKSRILKQAEDTDGQTEDDEDERTVFGEVLVPNIDTSEGPDSQNDTYTRKDVRDACYYFMEKAQHYGLMHDGLIDGKVKLLENYLAPADLKLKDMDGEMRTIPRGTWLMKLRIVDDDLWEQAKSGELTGFSIGGTGERTRVA